MVLLKQKLNSLNAFIILSYTFFVPLLSQRIRHYLTPFLRVAVQLILLK